MNNLVFLCGPHGGGKTTLEKKLQALNPNIIVPDLTTRTPKFHTNPVERITLKLCERAIENYDAFRFAQQHPDNVILANRCIYDADAYADVYLKLGWINEKEHADQYAFSRFAFLKELQEPYAIVLNPPFDVVWQRVQQRWLNEEKKWNEENIEYCRAACEAYEQFENEPRIWYLKGDEEIERVVSLIERVAAKQIFK